MHESCPELTNNEILKKAAEIHLEYKCKLNELLKDFKYSDCKALYAICDLAKGNNCAADMYYVIPAIKDSLLNEMQWHKFNRAVHGIDLT